MPITRFAPSPTGYLHLGHAYAALFAADCAAEGRFLLRIEDIDAARCRAAFETALLEDLAWLGLRWEEPVRRQSEHMDAYATSLGVLQGAGLLYPCFCTRKEIQAEIAAMTRARHGPDGPLYPGTCRHLDPGLRRARLARGDAHALRLDVAEAGKRAGPLLWHDMERGRQEARPDLLGDVVLARKDVPTSYHLAVCHDDAFQEITLVTRGEDLFRATHMHRLLQALLDWPTPAYRHHRLLSDDRGRRFAKRDAAPTLRALRAAGLDPDDLRARVGLQVNGPEESFRKT